MDTSPPTFLSAALQSSLIRRHQSASSLSLLDMSPHSIPLKGRQGCEAAIKAALHTPHHSSMLALPASPVPMSMVPARSVSPVDMKQEGPGTAAAAATAAAAGVASSPRLMQVAAAWS